MHIPFPRMCYFNKGCHLVYFFINNIVLLIRKDGLSHFCSLLRWQKNKFSKPFMFYKTLLRDIITESNNSISCKVRQLVSAACQKQYITILQTSIWELQSIWACKGHHCFFLIRDIHIYVFLR